MFLVGGRSFEIEMRMKPPPEASADATSISMPMPDASQVPVPMDSDEDEVAHNRGTKRASSIPMETLDPDLLMGLPFIGTMSQWSQLMGECSLMFPLSRVDDSR